MVSNTMGDSDMSGSAADLASLLRMAEGTGDDASQALLLGLLGKSNISPEQMQLMQAMFASGKSGAQADFLDEIEAAEQAAQHRHTTTGGGFGGAADFGDDYGDEDQSAFFDHGDEAAAFRDDDADGQARGSEWAQNYSDRGNDPSAQNIDSQDIDESEIAVLAEVNDTLAKALGACPLCWGGDDGCDVCSGRGASGSRVPDRALFKELVLPAVRRMQNETV